MSELRFPFAIKRLLQAGRVERVDLYAGRLLRDGEGRMTYRAANGNGNGNGSHPDHSGAQATGSFVDPAHEPADH